MDGSNKLDHEDYILKIAEYLIGEGVKTRALKGQSVRSERSNSNDLAGDGHFPEKIPGKEGFKRKPSRPCFACNGSWDDMRNKRLPKRCSGIWCKGCKRVLCVTPCFEVFHTNPDYKNVLLNYRFGNGGN